MNGDAQLDEIIRRVRAVKRLAREAAPEAARQIRAFLDARIAAGQAPDGTLWERRKRDGGRALVNAAKAITILVNGTKILIRLTGPEVFHHFGAGVPRRQVIPQGPMPTLLGRAVFKGFVIGFRRHVKGEAAE